MFLQNEVAHPFAVAVFKDLMYWDDWKQNSLYSANKDHGVSIQAIEGNLPGLMDLKVSMTPIDNFYFYIKFLVDNLESKN